MPCQICPDFKGCTAICYELEKLLPSMYLGKFGGGSNAPATGVEAVQMLYKDGMEPEEIAYHVPYELEEIERIIASRSMDASGLKKLAERFNTKGR